MEISLVFFGIVIVGLVVALIMLMLGRKKSTSEVADVLIATHKNRIAELERTVAELSSELENRTLQITGLTSEREVSRAQAEAVRLQLNQALDDKSKTINQLKEDYDRRAEELTSNHSKQLEEAKKTYEVLVEQIRESSRKQIEQLRESNEAQLKKIQELNSRQVEAQLQLIKDQMKTTSEEVLRQRQNELGDRNVEQVSKIVNPLMESLKGMKEAFDLSKEKQHEALTRLDETIRLNTKKNETLGETADRLARALTGEVKAQGNFGELKLRQMLENLELSEGEQYDTQETLRDNMGKRLVGDDGKGLVPDFILHFPNNRHVVIDAKMSLTAFERYMNTEDGSQERTEALQNHIQSVRANVSRLAKKSYTRFLPEGFNRLDFAFMYVPVDAALNLALLNDNTLWKDAYDQGVIILGPQTMYMNLRVLEMMWTQVKQLENQQKMIECANNIIDRVQDFAERFQDVDSSINKVVEKVNKFKVSIAPGGHSIITAAQNLVKAGGQENRKKTSLSKTESIFIEDDKSHLLN